MKEEVLRAIENYKSADKNLEYEVVMIHSQCLIFDTFSKSYHHYNFTMRTRQSRSKHWNYQQFFAEAKSMEGKTQYFCIPLQPSEHGHCFGCRKVGVSLRHPESGGYEKGNSGSGFPFDTDSESADWLLVDFLDRVGVSTEINLMQDDSHEFFLGRFTWGFSWLNLSIM